MSMKKTFIIVAFIFALFVTEKAQAQLGLHVDYVGEFINTESPTLGDTTFYYDGVTFGINWNFGLTKNLDLTAGLQYRTQWRYYSEHQYVGTDYVHYLEKHKQTLVDLPILLNYTIELGSETTFCPFVGPMLSWAISGTSHSEWTFPINTQHNENWYDENGERGRLNVYATAGIKFSYKKFSVSAGGRYGLLNLSKRDDATTKAYGFFASFGYVF